MLTWRIGHRHHGQLRTHAGKRIRSGEGPRSRPLHAQPHAARPATAATGSARRRPTTRPDSTEYAGRGAGRTNCGTACTAGPAPGRRRLPRTPRVRGRTNWPGPTLVACSTGASTSLRPASSSSAAARSPAKVGEPTWSSTTSTVSRSRFEPQHGGDEVGADARVDPCGAHDVGGRQRCADGAFAGELGACRRRLRDRSGRPFRTAWSRCPAKT